MIRNYRANKCNSSVTPRLLCEGRSSHNRDVTKMTREVSAKMCVMGAHLKRSCASFEGDDTPLPSIFRNERGHFIEEEPRLGEIRASAWEEVFSSLSESL